MEKEIWKDIPGYLHFYQVSNFGNVRSVDRQFFRENGRVCTREGKLKKLYDCKNGYKKVELSYIGTARRFYVHRLVAEAFIPNPDNLPEINHKDENPSNNHVDNLEWCTHEYNSNYGTRAKRIKNTMQSIGRSVPVLMYSKDGKFIRRFDSVRSASRELNIHCGSIVECCQGKRRKSAGGYVWKYDIR